MKFDLLLSDLVAYIVGFLGLVAAVVAVQHAISDAMIGSVLPAAVFATLAVVFFLPARRFLMSRPYHLMLARAWRWQQRIPFIVLNSVWIFLVTAFLKGTAPEDLFGAVEYAPWLFTSPVALAIWILFALVFVLPGWAFRPFRAEFEETIEQDVSPKPGLIQRFRQSQNSILIDVHPAAETAFKIADVSCAGLILLCGVAFMFSDTHASLEFLNASSPLIWPTTLVIFLCVFLPKNFGTRIVKETGDILYTGRRKLVNAGFALALSFGLAHLPFFYVIPWGYNALWAEEEAEVAYTVAGTVDYSFCRRGLSLSYPQDREKVFHVCDVDPSVRAAVSPGDTVFIRGKTSRFGQSAEVLRVQGQTTGA